MSKLDDTIRQYEDVRNNYKTLIDEMPDDSELSKACIKNMDVVTNIVAWLKELKWWRENGKTCETCKYFGRSEEQEPCKSCYCFSDKWKCGYKGGEEE